MAILEGVPHTQGLQLLKDELFERIKKFALVDDSGKIYHVGTVHHVYFDENGVLTVSFIIPTDTHFTQWNKSVRILADTGEIITNIQTPQIQFVKGVGGTQRAKLAVSGKAGQIIFKAMDYMTEYEVEEVMLPPFLAVLNGLADSQHRELKQAINEIQ